jgi:Uma2 family endonuclease
MAATAAQKRLKWKATVDDLYHVPEDGKAELVDGKLVRMTPTGFLPSRAGGAIYRSLAAYEEKTGRGFAIPDNAGFVVKLPRRRSFSPDAAFHVGKPTGAKFLKGAPVLAVEVRSVEDYGPAAEKRMTRKRADYFEAGTLIVWDVDVLRDKVVRVYDARQPDTPRVYRRGQRAEAEPALPGWSMPVEDLFAGNRRR